MLKNIFYTLSFGLAFSLDSSLIAKTPLCIAELRALAENHTKTTGQPANIAVAVVVIRHGKVLMGRRKSSGTWGFPGGTFETFDASLEDCGARETLEESGIKIKNIRLVELVPSFIQERGVYYFTTIAVAEWAEGDEIVREPDKSDAWGWFDWDQLPKPLFPPNHQLVESGFNPFR